MLNFFFNNFKKIILLSLLCIHEFAFASGNFFDITFNGSFQSSFTTNYKYTKTSYGIELGIPLSSFFEINIGELLKKSEKWQKAVREGRIGGHSNTEEAKK